MPRFREKQTELAVHKGLFHSLASRTRENLDFVPRVRVCVPVKRGDPRVSRYGKRFESRTGHNRHPERSDPWGGRFLVSQHAADSSDG